MESKALGEFRSLTLTPTLPPYTLLGLRPKPRRSGLLSAQAALTACPSACRRQFVLLTHNSHSAGPSRFASHG